LQPVYAQVARFLANFVHFLKSETLPNNPRLILAGGPKSIF
jgi:hypothetical protein